MIRIFGHFVPRAFLVLALVDIGIFLGSFYGGILLRFSGDLEQAQARIEGALLPAAIVFTFVMFGAMVALGMYHRQFREGIWGTLFRAAASLLIGFSVLVVLFYIFPALFVGRGAVGLACVIAMASVFVARVAFFQIVDIDRMKRRSLVLGAGERAAAINRIMRRKSDRRGLQIVGYIDISDHAPLVDDTIIEYDKSLIELVREYRAEELVVAVDDRRKNLPLQEIIDCRLAGVAVIDLVSLIERQCGKIYLDQLQPSWFIFSDGFRFNALRSVEKRIFDVFASIMLLSAAWPFLLFAAIAILMENRGRGPVLFRQSRVGEGGRSFNVLKFRSMKVDAEGDGKPQWAQENDHRVTRVGAVLRKYRVDELPQLFNVLKGDMSFVGPRPERPEFVESLALKIPYYVERHRVKPGITGWAQISYPYGASERDALEKLQYDMYYVKNCGLFLDLMILVQTAQTVIWGHGAR